MSKWLSSFRQNLPEDAQLYADNTDKQQAVSVLSVSTSPILEKTLSDKAQIAELSRLIYTVGSYYKATNIEIEEMISDVLKYHSIEAGLTTFRNLVEQLR